MEEMTVCETMSHLVNLVDFYKHNKHIIINTNWQMSWQGLRSEREERKNANSYPVWTMNRLKSHGFGRTLMHLLSSWCLKSALPTCTSNPTILLSAPADSTICFCCIPATPMTAEECIFLCNAFGFHEFSSSFSFQRTTPWSLPPVTKQVFSQGMNSMPLIIPLIWGLSSKKVTRALCQHKRQN